MSAKIEKVTVYQGVIAILFMAALSMTASSYLMVLTGLDTTFRGWVVSSWLIYVPERFLPVIVAGGAEGMIYAIVISGIHVVAWGYIGIFIVYLFNKYRQTPTKDTQLNQFPQFVQETDPDGYYLRSSKKLTEVVLIKPDGTVIRNITPDIQIRMDRTKLKFNREPKTDIEHLEAAITATLYKHRDWPADPSGHHSTTNLHDHSIEVAKALYKESKGHPLARTIGLAHDIGKILAYRKKKLKGGKQKWEVISKRHDKHSAHIVSLMPEFQKLKKTEQDTIITVLAFSHHPEMLPQRKITHHEMTLIQKLRKVDGLATKEDQLQILDKETQEDIRQILSKAIVSHVLPILNINMSRNEDAYADGWTNPGYKYIGVKESAVRDGLKSLIGSQINQNQAMAIGLETKIKSGEAYKATDYIIDSLSSNDMIFDSYDGIPAFNGMFKIRAGHVDFNNIILFKRTALEEHLGDMIEQWGTCKFKLKVKQNFTHQHNQNESQKE